MRRWTVTLTRRDTGTRPQAKPRRPVTEAMNGNANACSDGLRGPDLVSSPAPRAGRLAVPSRIPCQTTSDPPAFHISYIE